MSDGRVADRAETGDGARGGADVDSVIVLDFGSQYSQLIARRVRELNVYSELLPFDTPWSEIAARKPSAVILSGGPSSVYEDGSPHPDPAIWTGGVPILGICYGLHLMAQALGGEVVSFERKEFGPAVVSVTERAAAVRRARARASVWMSHGDSIRRLPDGFGSTARTDSTPYAAVADPSRRMYGIQFHPEVVHTPQGPRDPAQLRRRRSPAPARPGPPANFIASTVDEIRRRVDEHSRGTGTDGTRPVRPLRRSGFGRGRDARPPRRRRSADLRPRRPRPDAQERDGAAADGVRAAGRARSSSSTPASGSCASSKA